MELILQAGLKHQDIPVNKIASVFNGADMAKPKFYYCNPTINLNDARLISNIQAEQSDLRPGISNVCAPMHYLNLDIKMETGTGKTYVYTKTMYELHKCYGINKFVLVVPSLAIKAGTKQFIEDQYVKQHFADICGYNCDIDLCVLDAQKSKKKKNTFPMAIRDFVTGSCQNGNKIFVLLTNMQLLNSGKMMTRDDYDYDIAGYYQPMAAVRATRPFVIIDEPHRFPKGQAAFTAITEKLEPQCIIRFGATFPEVSIGRGSNKVVKKDYQNLLYDLNACESFNQNLVKGVIKEHFAPISNRDEKVKILRINNRESVDFQHITQTRTNTINLAKDDALSIIDEAFNGITITGITGSQVEFSNGIIKNTGEAIDVDAYMTSYQESMMKLALQRHFEVEKANFCDRKFKIKTLALFFIDDISSYRGDKDQNKEPYLKNMFERLLLERVNKTLDFLEPDQKEYKDYLLASKADLAACHAGYFSQDNNDSDENIAKEVNDILHNKKGLLAIKDRNGKFNVRRFLFSKWTLKEGWDNPNIFTITKLRSSGSDVSKIQEVGRGLRLPVDEYGNRISNEEFKLNYIVDFTEADFAEKLIKEINDDSMQSYSISEEKLQDVANKQGKMADVLFCELLGKGYIDRHSNIVVGKIDSFFVEYPDFAIGVNIGKIENRNKKLPRKIKIRKAQFAELKELWMAINQEYFLYFDKEVNNDLEKGVYKNIEKGVFENATMTSHRDLVVTTSEGASIIEATGVQLTIDKRIQYNQFLKRVNKATSLPITMVHNCLMRYAQEHNGLDEKLINEPTLTRFIQGFNEWKEESLQGRFHYKKCNFKVSQTKLTDNKGKVYSEIVSGLVGTQIASGTPSDKYLYDVISFDSQLEKQNITTGDIEEVVVYGKIPKNSIAIPTIAGGTYSPDFMYVVKKNNGEKEINIIVETKGVENNSQLRGTERSKIECAKIFFEQLKIDGYKVSFRTQLNNKKMNTIIDEIINS